MYKRILSPLDESRLAERILPYARTLARSFDIPVELLRVLEPADEDGEASPSLPVELRNDIHGYLEGVKRSFANPERVACTVEAGKAAETIIDRAADDLATLVAMSTHSRSGVERLFVGSVANKVLLATKSPLLLIRRSEENSRPSEERIAQIILPLDGSSLSELAMPHAIALAHELGASVRMVRAHSLAQYAAYGEGGLALEYPKLLEEQEKATRAYLEEKMQLCQSKGVDEVTYVVKEGDGAAAIADVAQNGDSLIVMCSHGKSGVGRWLLGGTADRVVRYSEHPVLVVRPPIQK